MTKYEEMCDTARTWVQNSQNRRFRCYEYLGKLFGGFLSYTQIPQSQTRYLRWNGLTDEDSRYEPAEEGMLYALPGAVVRDEEGFWHLGISLNLAAGVSVFFALCTSEQEGKPLVKIGRYGKTSQIDLESQEQCNDFYEEMVRRIKDSLEDPQKAAKTFGFSVFATEET